jgi:arylsulfatase A-like enzyme
MKRTTIHRFAFAMQVLLTLCFCAVLHADDSVGKKPNIILVLVDDMGWHDAGFTGNTFIETPTLDKLARDGLVFDRGYANAPNCAPGRAAIMSGQYAPRTDVYTMMSGDMGDKQLRRVLVPPTKMYLEPKIVTLAEMLKGAGYRTAQIGKWNLGSGEVRGPLGQGFDVNLGGFRGGDMRDGYFAPYDYLPGLENAPKGEYITNRLTDEAIRFIEQDDAHPFFIYLSHYAPHFPFEAPEARVKKYRHKSGGDGVLPEYAAMVDIIDENLGRILTALDAKHIAGNTVIIFTSDNGGNRYAAPLAPLRGNKSQLYEGGLRVPFFIWWPGHVATQRTNEPAMAIDLYPTLMHIAGVSAIDQSLDGVDLTPLFAPSSSTVSSAASPSMASTQPVLPRDALFWYFPAYVASTDIDAPDNLFTQRPAAVIQQQGWKLISYLDGTAPELYDLASDPSEKNNLAAREPQKVQALETRLHQWMAQMNLPLTLPPNPDFSAEAERSTADSWWHKLRMRLSETRYGAFLREKDLNN